MILGILCGFLWRAIIIPTYASSANKLVECLSKWRKSFHLWSPWAGYPNTLQSTDSCCFQGWNDRCNTCQHQGPVTFVAKAIMETYCRNRLMHHEFFNHSNGRYQNYSNWWKVHPLNNICFYKSHSECWRNNLCSTSDRSSIFLFYTSFDHKVHIWWNNGIFCAIHVFMFFLWNMF